jgi:hypothetical protein
VRQFGGTETNVQTSERKYVLKTRRREKCQYI